jgi:hypothetical protein
MLDDVERHYPARHYVMVDDKLRILAAMRKIWGDRLTTIWPQQVGKWDALLKFNWKHTCR